MLVIHQLIRFVNFLERCTSTNRSIKFFALFCKYTTWTIRKNCWCKIWKQWEMTTFLRLWWKFNCFSVFLERVICKILQHFSYPHFQLRLPFFRAQRSKPSLGLRVFLQFFTVNSISITLLSVLTRAINNQIVFVFEVLHQNQLIVWANKQ